MDTPTRNCEQCGSRARGRFCSYRCWRVSRGLPVDPPTDSASPTPDCVACGETRRNSKGGVCYPCQMAGRIPDEVPDVHPPIADEADEPTWSYCGEPIAAAVPGKPSTRKQPAAAGQLSLF